jgi:predicted aminopeptidase
LLIGLAGCGTVSYLGQAAWGEMRILLSRRPIDEALHGAGTDPARREALAWLLRAADDAETVLGLTRDRQYREVADLPDDFDVWVLTLAEPDRLVARTWRFPIAGTVPYLGFFDRGDAERFAERYHPDADRHLRTAAAFSTLGWLPEPVLPGLLALPETALINTVVHELVHASIYRPGESAWNEAVASALGDAGAWILMTHWGRPDLLAKTQERRADRARWQQLITEHAARMRTAYAALPEASARLASKPQLLAALQADIRQAPWSHPGWRRYADEAKTHAFVLAHETYATNPTAQTRWTAAAERDFRGAVAELRQRAESGADLWAPIRAAR